MAIGERIHFIRNLRGLTQKLLGIAVGLPEKSADVRMAQYETGNRTPKADLTQKLANVLDVSPMALDVPNIDSYLGLMHTLFALEDIYGLKIGEIDGEVCLRLDKSNISSYRNLFDMFTSWQEQAVKLQSGEITKEQYDQWRYNYPRFDTNTIRSKVYSDKLSNTLIDISKDM